MLSLVCTQTHRVREEDNKNFLAAKMKVNMWEKSQLSRHDDG